MAPKSRVLATLKRLTREGAILWPKAENIISKVIGRHSENPLHTRKYLFGVNFDQIYIGIFEKRHSVKLALYKGNIVLRPKWSKDWLTLKEFDLRLKLEYLDIEENKCKKNKTQLNKLKREIAKCRKLQQPVN
jgi:hypothetical protein